MEDEGTADEKVDGQARAPQSVWATSSHSGPVQYIETAEPGVSTGRINDLRQRITGVAFRSLDQSDPAGAERVKSALTTGFLTHSGLPATRRQDIEAAVRIDIGAGLARVSLSNMALITDWNGTIAELEAKANEWGRSFSDTYKEDRARGDPPQWD